MIPSEAQLPPGRAGPGPGGAPRSPVGAWAGPLNRKNGAPPPGPYRTPVTVTSPSRGPGWAHRQCRRTVRSVRSDTTVTVRALRAAAGTELGSVPQCPAATTVVGPRAAGPGV
eukprot:592376-Hanusia_phi.AAC.1